MAAIVDNERFLLKNNKHFFCAIFGTSGTESRDHRIAKSLRVKFRVVNYNTNTSEA